MSSSKMTAEGEKTRARIRGAITARSNTGTAGGASLFIALRKLLQGHAGLTVVRDEPGDHSVERNKVFFGGVRASRSHTSFYLAPLFADPAMLESVSPLLRKRIVGTSFVFKTVEPTLLEELSGLVARSLA